MLLFYNHSKNYKNKNDKIDSERKVSIPIDHPEYRKELWNNDIHMKNELANVVDKIILIMFI